MDEVAKKEILAKSDEEFESILGITKTQWLAIREEYDEREEACTTLPGSIAPEFSVSMLTKRKKALGDPVSLSNFRGETLALVFGSYTCPLFRIHTPRIGEVFDELNGDVAFLCIYTDEAHASDGWQVPQNEEEEIVYSQPKTLQQRARIAADWKDHFDINMPLALDDMSNSLDPLYAGSPERLYVIDALGIIKFRSTDGPFHESEIEAWRESIIRELESA